MSEWLKADKRVAVQTAAQAQEEQQAKDRATCAAAARKRKEYRSTNERAVGWESYVAEDSDHAGRLEPTTEKREHWKEIARKPPSANTGYTGVTRIRQLYMQSQVRADLSWEIHNSRGGSSRLRSDRN